MSQGYGVLYGEYQWPLREKNQPGNGSEGLQSMSDWKRLLYGGKIFSRYEKGVNTMSLLNGENYT
jgi:hypothetical protein